MTTERNTAEGTPRIFRSPWLSKQRTVLLAGLGTLGAGLALNWDWLTAVGVAPILLSLAPCAAMCGLGLCMRGGEAKSCASHRKLDAYPPPQGRQE